MKAAAILLTAGSGERFGSQIPKQFHRLAGRPVFLYALDTLRRSGLFQEILVICHPTWIDTARNLADDIRIIPGGATRQESSYLGLQALQSAPELVLIHDAVRPFVTEAILKENLTKATEWGAADTCFTSTDTIIYASADGLLIDSIPLRSRCLRGQTPQTFRTPLILQAHKSALQRGEQNSSDDCRLVRAIGAPIAIAAGAEENIKITSDLDLLQAEQIMRLRRPTPLYAPTSSLQDKTFAVVGGTGGIGRAIIEALEREGANALPLSRASAYPLNLSQPATIEAAFQSAGPLSGLINCAGYLLVKPLEALSLAEIEELLAVNLSGLIHSCRHASILPGGHIINIASSAYSRGRKNSSIYSSAKAAVVNFTQALAEERADLHIHTVIPHRTRTPMRQKNFPEDALEDLLEPSTVAQTVIDLLKDEVSTGGLVEVRKK